MGLFDTPAIVSSNIQKLRNKNYQDFDFDVVFNNNSEIFHVSHDYFESPFHFKVISWTVDAKSMPHFSVEYHPKNANILKIEKGVIPANAMDRVIANWQRSVVTMLSYEDLHTDAELSKIRNKLREKLGLSEENADEIIDEVQKKHAKQYCDEILDILSDLEDSKFDAKKIAKIKFDIEKIKRDLDSLKIKTSGALVYSISNAWAMVKHAKIGKYILEKVASSVSGKLIGDVIDKISGEDT